MIQVQLSVIHFTCTYTSALLYHSIPPAFVCFCTSALQCSWVDLMISTAKSCQQREIRFSTFGLSLPRHSTSCCALFIRKPDLVFEFPVESKLVFWLSIGHLVFPEPLDGSLQMTWSALPNIFYT